MRIALRRRLRLVAALVLASGLASAHALGAGPADVGGPAWTLGAVLHQPGWQAGSVTYSRDGKRLVVGGTGGHVWMYDLGTWKTVWEAQDGQSEHPAAVVYTPDGTAVAVTGANGVRFLDAATGTTVDVLEEKSSWPMALAVFPDVPAGSGRTVRQVIFGHASGYVVKTWIVRTAVSTTRLATVLPNHMPADPDAVPLAVDPAGRHAVVNGPIDRATGKNVLWAWSAGSRADNHLLEGHTATVTAAAWSADGKTVATGDTSGTVVLWDGATFREKEKSRRTLPGRVAALALTHDGGRAAAAVIVGRVAKEVHVWPAGSPPETPTAIGRQFDAEGPFVGVAGVAFAPDGKGVAAGFLKHHPPDQPGSVRIWTVAGTR